MVYRTAQEVVLHLDDALGRKTDAQRHDSMQELALVDSYGLGSGTEKIPT